MIKTMKINFKSKKFWIIASAIALGVLLVVATLVVYFVMATKIDVPKNLRCYKLSNGEIYIEVDESERAKEYQFKIIKNGGESQFIKSQSPVVDVTSYFSDIGEFKISCQVIGALEASNSDYTAEITYTHQQRISTPEVELNQAENRLYFSLNDSFSDSVMLVPTLIYGITQQGDYLQTTNAVITSQNHHGVMQGYFDLSFLENGEYSISLKIYSNNQFVLESLGTTQIICIIPPH